MVAGKEITANLFWKNVIYRLTSSASVYNIYLKCRMYSNHRLLKYSVIYLPFRAHQVSILEGLAKIWPRSSFIYFHIYLKPPLPRLQILTGGVWMTAYFTCFSCGVGMNTYQNYYKLRCLKVRTLESPPPMPPAAHTHLWALLGATGSPPPYGHFAQRPSFPCVP